MMILKMNNNFVTKGLLCYHSGVRYGPTAFNPIDEVALMVKDDMTEAILQMPGLRQRFGKICMTGY